MATSKGNHPKKLSIIPPPMFFRDPCVKYITPAITVVLKLSDKCPPCKLIRKFFFNESSWLESSV
jgi:hypothetical protein